MFQSEKQPDRNTGKRNAENDNNKSKLSNEERYNLFFGNHLQTAQKKEDETEDELQAKMEPDYITGKRQHPETGSQDIVLTPLFSPGSNPAAQKKEEESGMGGLNPIEMLNDQKEAISKGVGMHPVQQKEIEQEKNIQKKPSETDPAKSPSTPMPENVQSKMENSFGTSFSDVSIHTNDEGAKDMGALAYTQGKDVHFAPGQYSPNTQKGQELIGHELTHVVQQREGRVRPIKQGKGLTINDNPALENEADEMGKRAAEGKSVNITGNGSGIQKDEDKKTTSPNTENAQNSELETQNETEESTTESSGGTTEYLIVKKDANIRVNEEPHNAYPEGKPLIPIGTKVILLETYDNKRYKIQKADDASQVWWTSKTNVEPIETFSDSELHTAFYNDSTIFSTPGADAGKTKLEAGKKYQILNKCLEYHQVQKEGAETPTGWIKDYKYNLYKGAKVTRSEKLAEYIKWLEDRYKEATEKTGNDQIKFIQGILYQAECISENIAKDPPVYPDTKTLNKNPSFSESENTAKNTSVPHELISVLRSFIEITEKKPAESKTTETPTTATPAQDSIPTNPQPSEQVPDTVPSNTAANTNNKVTGTNTPNTSTSTNQETTSETTENRIIGGSRHSNIDWNTRLKVPQYRTQSDNLTIPESTCNVTTMAMNLERLGNSRADVIAAIDAKLSEGVEKPDLDNLWKSKSEKYLKKITSDAGSSDYKKLRAGSSKSGSSGGDLVGKESDISKVFKEIAQMEDLIDFYLYLTTSNLDSRYSIFANTYNDKIPEKINSPSEEKTTPGTYKTTRKNLGTKQVSMEQRDKIKTTLDGGGAVVLSINHKGTSGSHIIYVQSISSDGLIVDDPYGGHASDYRYGTSGDLFAGKGKGSSSRNTAGYKNKVHDNASETDYTKRDFTAEAAQNLEADESRGKSILLKWEMINESKSKNGKNLFNYIVFYEKN